MLHDSRNQTANNESVSESCSAYGKQYSSVVANATQMTSENTRIEQIGHKKRIVDIASGTSSSANLVFPLAVISLGKAQLFDAKDRFCSITSRSISFGANVYGGHVSLCVNSDEVEELLFCEPLKVLFFIFRKACMIRITETLGVTCNKDDRKSRVVIVLDDKHLREPYECSAKSPCLTALQLEGFCTNVRVAGGLAMTDLKSTTAQSILTGHGLRLNQSPSAIEINRGSASVDFYESVSNCLESSLPPVTNYPMPPTLISNTNASEMGEIVSLCEDSDDECKDNEASPNSGNELSPSLEPVPSNGNKKPEGFLYRPPGSKDSVFLTYSDIGCLLPGNYLNDTIINFYLKYLYYEQFSDQQRHSTYMFNSFFYARLCAAYPETSQNIEEQEIVMARHKAVANWTRRADIFTKDYIIIPINENLHWFLGLVCYPWMVGMVSYNKLYAEYNYDQCQLIPDFADTNIDPTIGDVGTEEIKILPTDVRGEAFNRWRRRRLTWLRKRGINAMPCILLFDSLSSQHRVGNLHKIRSYLQAEWDVRRSERDGNMFFNKDTVRGFSPRVPGQSNLVDCGIFLLHYVEMFFKRPVKSYTREYFQNEMSRWFESDMLGKKRSVISKLIDQLSQRSDSGRSTANDFQ